MLLGFVLGYLQNMVYAVFSKGPYTSKRCVPQVCVGTLAGYSAGLKGTGCGESPAGTCS